MTIFYLKPVGSVPIIEDALHLTYAENTGAAFSMFDEPDERWIFMSISTVAIVALLVYFFVRKPTDKWECLSLAFIIGGGIGNMIDRFLLGYVVDMIDFCLIDFAVFNVADSFVCIGAGLLMLTLIRGVIREAREEKQKALAGGDIEVATAPVITEETATAVESMEENTDAAEASDSSGEDTEHE